MTNTTSMSFYNLGIEAGELIKERERIGRTKQWRKKVDDHIRRCREAGLNVAGDALDGSEKK